MIAVRPAGPADLDALLQLEEAAFATDRLDRRAFRHAIASPTVLALAAGPSHDLAGYVLVQVRRGSRIGRLTSVAVAPGQAGRGLGRALLAAAERAARTHGCDRLRLEVRADNAAARRLYEGAGYARFDVVEDYYEDGTAAWRYERPLPPDPQG